MLRRSPLVLLAAAAALALSACSGGSPADGVVGGSSSAEPSGSASGTGGVLRVASEGTYAPFTFHDQADGGKLTGYDVDVITAVAQEMGMQVEFTDVTWDAIFAGLQAGRYDVVANQVTVNPERQALYDFSTPYTTSTGAIITRADDTAITSVADLAGKTTAQSLTSNWAQVATDAGAQVEGVEGFTQAVTLLKQGRVDATVNDDLAALDYLKTTGDTSVKIAGSTPDTSQQAFALAKGSDLTPKIDEALAQLQADGTLAEISTKYFGEDVSQ
ncbi:amino acid ABC transporter substrate-binding protein [Quadrisphaera sp. INWT6]|uniref:amino acid ABC transporter substrate-binding protein n=1 Tax=Quadrisphaera sp. INWT6 TaxID=2596917 RepID=UPI0018928764|nr:amino acid ABC transporter substrate-binding protein [Quadrisphaera sp. INWT6]MBF5081126.1 amino acid ABC transporter substrate-binding protein [Quadrisphaera sp. INWT6]